MRRHSALFLSVLLAGSFTAVGNGMLSQVQAKQPAAETGVGDATGWETSFTSWPVHGGTAKAVILSIHGFGLHKGAFDAFAERMNQEQIAVYAIDVRGFGSWTKQENGLQSKRAKVDFYQTLIDVGTALSWLHRMHPQTPVYLLGESMGGSVALQAAALFPDSVDGLIASVPGDEYFKSTSARFNVALRMVRPDRPFDLSERVIDRATSKEEVKNSWQDDPHARLQLSPKELIQFRHFMKRSHELAPTITKTPVLMFQGVKDQLTKPDGTIKLFHELQTPHKDLVMLGNTEHLIFEKAQFNERIIDLVSNWVLTHGKPAEAAVGETR